MKILSGLIVGAMFGFALHRGGLTRYSRIMGVLLLRDFKAMNFMFTGVAVAAILYGLSDLLNLPVAPRINGYFNVGHILGGILFGIGMGISGLCPGTCATRFASGKLLTGLGVLGLFVGVYLYDLLFPVLSQIGGDPRFITWAMVLDIRYGYLAVILGIIFFAFAALFHKIDRAKRFDQDQKRQSLLRREWGWLPAGAIAGVLIFTATALGEYLSFAGGFLALGAHIASFFDYTFESVPVLNESTLWRAMLVPGLFLGAFLSSYLAKATKTERVTPLFQEAFGPKIALRGLLLFLGPSLMSLGALIGGGCTTGAFMSGWPTLSVGSFAMAGTFFATAMVTAHVMFYGRYYVVRVLQERMVLTLATD